MLEDTSGKKARALEYLKKDLEKSKVGTYVGASMTWKKSLTKMKSLNKRLVQTHDSNSNVDEDWVTLIESDGWSEDLA